MSDQPKHAPGEAMTIERTASLLDDISRAAFDADEQRVADARRDEPDARPPFKHDQWRHWLRRDYREFLRRVADEVAVSKGTLGRWIGRSPGSTTYLLNPATRGERLRVTFLSGAALETLIDRLTLPDDEASVLRHLVHLETSRRTGEGNPALFKRLVEQAWVHDTGFLLHDEVLRYAGDFLNIVVREMVGLDGFHPEPEWIRAHLLYPFGHRVDPTELRRVWSALRQLKLVSPSPDGSGWVRGPQSEVLLSSGQRDRKRALTTLFETTQDAGREALGLPSHRRRFECRTVPVMRRDLERITEEFNRLLDGLEEAGDGEGEVVMHVQLVAFPVADIHGRVEPPPEEG